MALASGTHLGQYEILAPLGAGGMGEVYRARDIKLGREVAIKILPEEFAADADRVARFQREARTLASLNHPNIAIIHGLEHAGAVHALVMELVDGQDLSQRIARGAIPLAEALAIATQIAEALEAAHDQGIVHRDLKPANIKVRDDGRVKVLDFGLAKAMDGAGTAGGDLSQSPTITSPAMTAAGMILGTAAYMSPEQAKGRPADKRSDVWSFGCVLFEMLSGARPFAGDGVSDTLAAVLRSEPDWSLLRGAPRIVERLVRDCLVKDPSKRINTLSTVLYALKQIDEITPSTVAVTAQRAASSLGWKVAALVLLVTSVGAALAAWRARPSPSEQVQVGRYAVSPPSDGRFAPIYESSTAALAVSPDGKHVAFAAVEKGGDRPSLWIRSLDRLEPRRLVSEEGNVTNPFWSPDSRFVGFFLGGRLRKVSLNGGPSQAVCDAPAEQGGTWSRDGVILFSSTPRGGLLRVSPQGGDATVVMRSDAPQAFPSFLPDGRRFLFLQAGAIHLGSLDSNETRRLMAADSNAEFAGGHLFFMRQQSLLAQPFDVARGSTSGEPFPAVDDVRRAVNGHGVFSTSNTTLVSRSGSQGKSRLTWLDRTGKTLGTVGEPDYYRQIALSPDETQLAFERLDPAGGSDLWLMDLGRGISSRFTSAPGEEAAPIWSRSGDRIFFRSNTGGAIDLVEKSLSGGDERLLVNSPFSKYAEDVSPDSKLLAYIDGSPPDIWMMPLAGEPKRFRWLETPFAEDEPNFSPDGRWVSYISNESGRWEAYAKPFDGTGARVRLSATGAGQPRWRRDGKEVVYLTPDGTMMAVSVSGANTLQAGAPIALFKTGIVVNPAIDQFVFTRDAQRFLVAIQEQEGPQTMTVVLNWQEEIKAKVPTK